MKVEITGYSLSTEKFTYTVDGVEKTVQEEDAYALYEDLFSKTMIPEMSAVAYIYKKAVDSGIKSCMGFIGLSVEVDQDGIPV